MAQFASTDHTVLFMLINDTVISLFAIPIFSAEDTVVRQQTTHLRYRYFSADGSSQSELPVSVYMVTVALSLSCRSLYTW